jgi:hypothetical protein
MLQRALLLAPYINRASIVGVVYEPQLGYIGNDTVFQCTVVCNLIDPQKLPTSEQGKEGAVPLARRSSHLVKQQYIVRCFGSDEYASELRKQIAPGCFVKVEGVLRLNRAGNQPHPYIHIRRPRGNVTILGSLGQHRKGSVKVEEASTSALNSNGN